MQDPSDWAEWVWVSAGGVLVALGYLGLVLTFRDHVPKGARRCPKCKYDMLGTPGMRCPECGQVAKNEKRLTSPVYRWRHLVWASAAVVGVVYVVIVEDRKGEGWWALVPSTYLVLFTDLEADWPTNRGGERLRCRESEVWTWQCWIVLLRAGGVGDASVEEFVLWRERWPVGVDPIVRPDVPSKYAPVIGSRTVYMPLGAQDERSICQVSSRAWTPVQRFWGWFPSGEIELAGRAHERSEHVFDVEVRDSFGSASRRVLAGRVSRTITRVAELAEAIEPVTSPEIDQEMREDWRGRCEFSPDGICVTTWYDGRHRESRSIIPDMVRTEFYLDGQSIQSRITSGMDFLTFRLKVSEDDSDIMRLPLAPLASDGQLDTSRLTVRVTGDGLSSLRRLDAREFWSGSFEISLDELLKQDAVAEAARAARSRSSTAAGDGARP